MGLLRHIYYETFKISYIGLLIPADTLYPGICNILQATVGILSEVGGHSTTTWTEYCHFFPPPPLRGQFLYPERGQKQAFFTPLI